MLKAGASSPLAMKIIRGSIGDVSGFNSRYEYNVRLFLIRYGFRAIVPIYIRKTWFGIRMESAKSVRQIALRYMNREINHDTARRLLSEAAQGVQQDIPFLAVPRAAQAGGSPSPGVEVVDLVGETDGAQDDTPPRRETIPISATIRYRIPISGHRSVSPTRTELNMRSFVSHMESEGIRVSSMDMLMAVIGEFFAEHEDVADAMEYPQYEDDYVVPEEEAYVRLHRSILPRANLEAIAAELRAHYADRITY